MVRHDSRRDTTTDSEVGAAAKGAGRLIERHALSLKIAAFYGVVFGAGLLLRRLVEGQELAIILSIGIWFTVIFAVCTALLGICVKLINAVQRRRHDYE